MKSVTGIYKNQGPKDTLWGLLGLDSNIEKCTTKEDNTNVLEELWWNYLNKHNSFEWSEKL